MGNFVSPKKGKANIRHIYPSVNNSAFRERYCSNAVHTCKYNVITFIPKNLIEQFHRFANIYFVFIIILNFLPEMQAFGREFACIPVVFVLAVTACKDAIEDWRRRQSDRRVNEAHCSVFNPSSRQFENVKWQVVKCGDLVEMRANETVPADIVLLHSSDQTGLCHLETANIDGESNLKMRQSVIINENERFRPEMLARRYLDVEQPNKEIYKFAGTIYRQGESTGIALKKHNLLLRGCTLRNTEKVVGIVVYTGKETKAMLNNNATRFKRSKLERQINRDVIWCALLLILLCLSCAMGNLAWSLTFFTQDYGIYSFPSTVQAFIRSSPMQAFLTFWTCVIYYQAMIPLPLYVTFELVKMHQVFHIRQDLEMYDDVAGKGLEVRAFNIPEDLGQIQYIFCDKTGTLTENKMEFKRACIRGSDYVDVVGPPKEYCKTGNGTFDFQTASSQDCPNEGEGESMLDLVNAVRHENEGTMDGEESLADVVRDFFMLMAVCNTTVVSSNKNEKNPVIKTKKPDLRSKIKKRFQIASEGMSKAASISAFNAKNLFAKTARISMRNTEWNDAESKDPENEYKKNANSSELINYTRRESTMPIYDQVDVMINDEPLTKPDPTSRKVHSVIDFRKSMENADPDVNKLPLPTEWPKDSSYTHSQCDSFDLQDCHNAAGTLDSPPKCPLSDDVLFDSYESESPDEMALVKTACKYGYKLLQRGPGFVTIWNPETEKAITQKVLQILEFDSTRKRMSVIVQCDETNEKILYCKGADSAMFCRLASSVSKTDIEDTKDYVDAYSKKGLRTLVMGKRVINEDFFDDWNKRYTETEQKVSDTEAELSSIISEMENEMTLLGVSAIEDCLQEGVPDTIESLQKAGITVWILTGDKRETAINIAYSAKLFTDDQRLITLSASSTEELHEIIKTHLAEIECKRPNEILEIRQGHARPLIRQDLALCVDGDTLTLAMCLEVKMDFLRLAEQCRSVVCARTTPMQKAEMVQLIKENLRMQTLAIGDGANDVSMIQTADVGIGVGGNEGMQAVMASDFAMTKFKHLKRLLLVHGSWCYNKLARTALWMFYKDTIYILLMFWFQFYNAFSASVQIDQLTQILFNITMTGLPPIIYGIWDKDHHAETLMRNPQLYTHGINCKSYKPWHFWINILDSVWQSLMIFFICYGAFTFTDIGIWEFGQIITICALLTCLLNLGIETRFWTWFHVMAIAVSVLLAYFAFTFIYNSICGPVVCSSDGQSNFIFVNVTRPVFWLLCLVSPATAVLPRLAITAMINSIRPNILIKAQLREKGQGKGTDLKFDYKPELVSIKRTSTILNPLLRRPTNSDMRQISQEYRISSHGDGRLPLRPNRISVISISDVDAAIDGQRASSHQETLPSSKPNGSTRGQGDRRSFQCDDARCQVPSPSSHDSLEKPHFTTTF